MPLRDLSRVTRTLVTLLRDHIAQSPAWLPRPPPAVTPHPPDRLEGQGIGFYLYNVREEAHAKNALPIGPGHPPVRFTPMGVTLHYLLTAVSDADGDQQTYMEQLLMSCAMKALHDYPVLGDETALPGGTPFFETHGIDGAENRLRVELQPITHEQSINYWTASSSQPRLAAYYQVSVVYIEPERPVSRTGRVLAYGVHTFVSGAPRLDGTFNSLELTLPGAGEPRTVELRPAEVPYDATFELFGSDLVGDETALLIRGPGWDRQVEVGPSWGVSAMQGRVLATVQQEADGEPVLPGTYSAQVVVRRRKTMPDGTTRVFAQRSNQTPFTVSPRVDDPPALDGTGTTTVSGYPFDHASFAPDALEVHVGDAQLAAGTAGSLAPGEFGVVNATQLEVRVPGGLPAGVHLIRIVVQGAQARPVFVEVTA